MEKMIKEYVDSFEELIQYEEGRGNISLSETDKINVKKELEKSLNDSDMLWSVVPYSDAAYSIMDDLFSEVISKYKI